MVDEVRGAKDAVAAPWPPDGVITSVKAVEALWGGVTAMWYVDGALGRIGEGVQVDHVQRARVSKQALAAVGSHPRRVRPDVFVYVTTKVPETLQLDGGTESLNDVCLGA